jgi:Mrp family chromosome partitioning ATPase
MARILDALRSKAPAAPPAAPSSERKPEAAPRLAAATAPEPVTPFIEVGGGQVDGSPDVLSAAPAPATFLSLRPRTEPKPAIEFEAPPDAPSGELAPELLAFHDPHHAVSRQYQELLDRVVASVPEGHTAALLMSGAMENVGTTTALLNLAITLAGREVPVAVVDACLAKPALAERLGISTLPGLTDVCAGEVRLAHALHGTRQPNLWVLTAGEAACRPTLALRSFPGILAQLRRRFDWVLVDSPAWQSGAEMLGLAAACDALFLVAPPGHYENADFAGLLRFLPRQGIRLAGCIVTRRP